MQIVGRTRKWVQAQKNDGHAAHAQTSKSSKTDMMPELQLDILPAFCPRQEKKWVPPLSDGSGKRAKCEHGREKSKHKDCGGSGICGFSQNSPLASDSVVEVSLAGKPTRTFRLP
jgi:hypothetical protein